MIWQAKFHARENLATALGRLLVNSPQTRELVENADILMPVPMSPFRTLTRGYNHSESIARVVSRECNISMNLNWRRRHRKPQHRLKRHERLKHLHGTFRAPKNVQGKRVLVVDDVVTTGATFHESARSLYAAGATQVDCIACAYADWSYVES